MPTVSEQGCHSEAVNASQIGEIEIRAAEFRARRTVLLYDLPESDTDDLVQDLLCKIVSSGILESYDPSKSARTTFVHYWCRVFCRQIIAERFRKSGRRIKVVKSYSNNAYLEPSKECEQWLTDLGMDLAKDPRLASFDLNEADSIGNAITNNPEAIEFVCRCFGATPEAVLCPSLSEILWRHFYRGSRPGCGYPRYYLKEWQTLKATGVQLNVSSQVVRRMIDARQINATKMGSPGCLVASTSSVGVYLESVVREIRRAIQCHAFFQEKEQTTTKAAVVLRFSKSSSIVEMINRGLIKGRRVRKSLILVDTRSVRQFLLSRLNDIIPLLPTSSDIREVG